MFEEEKWAEVLCRQYGEDAIELVEAARSYLKRNPGVPQFIHNLSIYFQFIPRLPTELRALRADPIARDLLFGLIKNSRFGFDLVMQNRRLFWQIIQQREFRQVWGRSEMLQDCRKQLSRLHHYTPRIEELVRFHQYHTLRLLLGDIGGCIELESIIAEISDLTDVVVECALELALEKYQERYGKPQTRFVVFGMGKLGGRELNYSSDIDLIFMYGQNGSTAGENSTDHHDFYKRVGAELIRILDEHHANGRLYRVDMRLRPEGDAGELVLSFDETLNYYYTLGRHWERQAMIKARPIAGHLPLGRRLLKELNSWIYSHTINYDKVGQARAMRRQIEHRSQEEDLKAGVGGIRDIEFMVQYLQLIYGARYPDLRNKTTIPSLHALADHGLLPTDEVTELIEYYSWLRMAEHRLQMYESRQLHEIPTEPEDLLFLAHRCGFEGSNAREQFLAHLNQVRSRVREIADQYYLKGTAEKDALIALILDRKPQQELIDQVLDPIGFENKKRALKLIRSLAREQFFLLSRARTESALIELLPSLLALLETSPEPDQTLSNFCKIVNTIGGRHYFFEKLTEDPELMLTVMTFAGWADFLIDYLVRFPGLIDDLFEQMDPEDLYLPNVLQETEELIQGLTDPVPSFAYIQAREIVRIALHDLQGFDHLSVCKSLSFLARDIISVGFDFCARQLAQRWGWPERDGKRVQAAVLGLGKLGSGEMSYASDVDVIFVSEAGGICTVKDRDGEAFWTRVVTDLIKMFEQVYEIDPRLRPWGDQGQMVISIDALKQYWSQPRDLWERLAMTRVAYLCGDKDLAGEAVQSILAGATERALPADAAAQIRHMRQRMEDSVKGRDHLKRGYGGYVDIEFIAQYLSLACLKGPLPASMDIRTCLSYLSEQGCLEKDDAEQLQEALRILRGIEARMRLSAGKAISSIPTKPRERLALARRCTYIDVDTLNERVQWSRQVTRPLFESLIS